MSTVESWARQQWDTVELGDKRRTERAVRLGTQIAACPDQSLPKQAHVWGDLKAAYRLLHQEAVTHKALSLPHWRATRCCAQQADGPVLFVQDGSQLDFTFRDADGLGRIGNNDGSGLLMHSVLAVQPGQPATVLGLAHQLVWVRDGQAYKPRETRADRSHRADRESSHWSAALEAIGPVPANACWVSVGDRESDIFDYWDKARALGWHCLLRLAQDRCIVCDDGKKDRLRHWSAQLPVQAYETLTLRTRPERKARVVTLSLAWGHVSIMAPQNGPDYSKRAPLSVWVLRVWEATPPAGEKPLEWLLLSTLPITTADQAHERVSWYRNRWIIEQYHKALKTGCRMEESQLQHGAALTRLLGFLSIVAVRLLQVETLARSVPALPAARVVDHELLTFLCLLRKRDPASMTVKEFWREVAKFGGFLARKHDGEPGWQTLWKG